PRLTTTAIALLALCASPTLAKPAKGQAPAGQAQAQALQDLTHCRTITDDQARLACFDKAAAAFDQAEQAGDVIVVDRAQAHEVKQRAFGLNLSSALSVFDRGSKPEQINQVSLTVKRAVRTAEGRWVITMEEGEVWRQIDSETLDIDPRP